MLLVALLALGLAVGLGAGAVSAPAASPPDPTYGSAVVDGSFSEWNTGADFFASMYLAGNASKAVLANGYLRYDCSSHTLYVLVLQAGYGTGSASPLLSSPTGNAWSTINGGSTKQYTDTSGNNSSPPAFAWIGLGYDSTDATYAQGYEASFSIAPGSYTLIVHVEALDSTSTAATAAFLGFGGHPSSTTALNLSCPSTTTTATTGATTTNGTTTDATTSDATTTDATTTDATTTDATTTDATTTDATTSDATTTDATTTDATTTDATTSDVTTTDATTSDATTTNATTTDAATTDATTSDVTTTDSTTTDVTTTDFTTTSSTTTGTTTTTPTTTGTTTTAGTSTTPTTTGSTTTGMTATEPTMTGGTTATDAKPSAEDIFVTNRNADVADPVAPAFKRVYGWKLRKRAAATRLVSSSSTTTFQWTVAVAETGFKDSGWTLDGEIKLTNPNKFSVRGVLVTDSVDDGGMCTVSHGLDVTLPARGVVELTYHCTYASAPEPGAGINTVTTHWDGARSQTPNSSAQSHTPFAFHGPTRSAARVVTITDSAVGKLGTVTARTRGPFASRSFRYAHAVRTPTSGCKTYTNRASIRATQQTMERVVTACHGQARPARIQAGFTG